DSDSIGLADRFAQQGIGLVASLSGRQVVRLVEKEIVDRLSLDEIENVDSFGLFERRSPEVLFGQHHEATFLVLETLHQVLPGNGMALLLTHALEVDRRAILRVQEPKTRAAVPHGCMNLHRDVQKTERESAGPDSSSHECSIQRNK